MGQLDGKIALVTAGGGGIGQATAMLLAERGARVIAADIDPAGLAETLKNCTVPDRLRSVVADATTLAGAEAAVRAATDAFGGLSILVNVVGGSKPGKTVVDLTPEEWDGWVRLNLTSTFLMCKAAIPAMAASGGGSIVNISSGAGVNGMRKNPAYVAAKGGVVSLTKSLAIDHAEQKIRANCIAPGAILTPLMKRNRRQEEIDWMANANLVGRIGLPHDIAAMVAFLSSDDGAFVNGELINVSGGPKAGI
ncbi:MAG TPA: SDR family oxidoreductase [Rhodopila sp.]|jgi:NAD(P)-dependent dehydrogenase (short-subunit alcohol dehydrogenase family)|nr:SDR family oxidoreductase [Rhodopila sp.]